MQIKKTAKDQSKIIKEQRTIEEHPAQHNQALKTPKHDKRTMAPSSNTSTIEQNRLDDTELKIIPLNKVLVNKQILDRFKSAPPILLSPTSNQQVGSPLIVKGTGLNNTAIEINVQSKYDHQTQDLGLFRTTSDANGNWQTFPINLWAPDDAQNISYIITVTQFDQNNNPSREARVVALPKKDNTMFVLNSNLVRPKLKPKLKGQLVAKKHEVTPIEFGPVDKPIIINPTNGYVSRDGRIQIMGIGTEGHQVKSNVVLNYFSQRKEYQKTFNFISQVGENGIWRTVLKHYPVPNDAYDIQYTIGSQQIRLVDNKASEQVTIQISQLISNPKLSNFTYKKPDFPSTGTGQVWDGITGTKYYENIQLRGQGGAGLKVSITNYNIRDGEQEGSRSGTVDVDRDGKWKWDTGWRYSHDKKDIDSFLIKITQSNPGDESDRSETIVEYRTK